LRGSQLVIHHKNMHYMSKQYTYFVNANDSSFGRTMLLVWSRKTECTSAFRLDGPALSDWKH